jgi:site-specific recombinase XerD
VKRGCEDPLSKVVQSFFRDYLQSTRGASPRTVLAYRDGLRLLFRYLADTNGCSVADLSFDDLQVDRVLAFLSHLETDRGNVAATRNARLSAIQSFFRHLLRNDPTRAEQYHRVLALPLKKARPPLACYLEPEEVRVLLGKPDGTTATGLRDHALLLVLYNTGARVSEALAMRGQDLELLRPRQVRLRGKGGKERYCPLWKDTAAVLQRLLDHHALQPEEVVFRNARGGELTRDGVAYILRKYVTQSLDDLPELRKRKVRPRK